jgi:hypothetical protein
METLTMGGSRDTLVNELAVMPWGVPSGVTAVTMVMPVANFAHARRNTVGVTPDGSEPVALDKLINPILS